MSIKTKTKKILIDARVWYPISLVRNVPAILRWIAKGCRHVAPHPIKMVVVKSYLKSHNIKNFVETGTYMGDTLSHIAETGVRCTSIELSPELYQLACERFARNQNVRLVLGDSGKCLPKLLAETDAPTLFWLDGHYSSGVTALGETHTPISVELAAIMNHRIKTHVILIDDARCFDGSNDYPYLDELMLTVRENGRYKIEIATDIIRLVPANGSTTSESEDRSQ